MTDVRASLGPPHLWRYLPLVVFATASVVAFPVVIVAIAAPRGGLPSIALSALATVAVSVAIASLEAALWTRLSRSQDLTFAELMLWGWLRRLWTERRGKEQEALYLATRSIAPAVSIDQLERLSRMLEARDPYTHGHSRRVARHAARIARKMHLPKQEIAKIRTAAIVHDVGKIYTPKEVLNNPERLTDAEYEVVKRHAADGAGMLTTVGNPEIAAMVRHHHERIDGSGYPDGLAGGEIPIGARIIAVADTFDALTSSRPYRDANTHRTALNILSREAGAQLDRDAVAAFLQRYSSRRSIASFSFAAALPQRIFAALQSASTGLGASASGATSILPALGASGLLALSAAQGHRVRTSDGSARRGGVSSIQAPANAVLDNTRAFRSNADTKAGRPASHGGSPGSAMPHRPNSTGAAKAGGSEANTAPGLPAASSSHPTTGGGGNSPSPPSGPVSLPGGPVSPPGGPATPPGSPSVTPAVAGTATGTTEAVTNAVAETITGTAGTVSASTKALPSSHSP